MKTHAVGSTLEHKSCHQRIKDNQQPKCATWEDLPWPNIFHQRLIIKDIALEPAGNISLANRHRLAEQWYPVSHGLPVGSTSVEHEFGSFITCQNQVAECQPWIHEA